MKSSRSSNLTQPHAQRTARVSKRRPATQRGLASILVALAFLTSLTAAENDRAYHYKEPIVFCRGEGELKTGKVLLASKIWVMESDGSHARQLTTGMTYDDHPSLYSDLEHVLYSEIAVNEFKPA